MMPHRASIAVLAGGESRRLGEDKALVSLTEGGPPMLELVLERVRPLTDDLFIVSAARAAYARFDAPLRPDQFVGAGPLGGIGTALRAARFDRCLVVSCDQPFLSRELLGEMLADEDDWDVLVPVLPGASRQGGSLVRQTLHAVYRSRCLAAIEQAIGERRLKIADVYRELSVKEIDIDVARRFDPTLRSFFSVNTPESLARARSWASE